MSQLLFLEVAWEEKKLYSPNIENLTKACKCGGSSLAGKEMLIWKATVYLTGVTSEN